jgi:hypothetical protein
MILQMSVSDEGGWSGSTYFYIKIYFFGLSVRLTIWTRARKMFGKHNFYIFFNFSLFLF